MRARTAATVATLERFQDVFAQALLRSECDERAPSDPVASLAAQPGFAVYRNTVLAGCIDALQANYPAVARLVGDEWFRAAGAIYVRAHPPRVPMLLEYGEGFARFLATFEPAAELPYLPGVATLDRFWTEAHVAVDAAPLGAGLLQALDPSRLGAIRLALHPSARWAWFPDAPVVTLWRRNRSEAGDPNDPVAEIDWRGEGALVLRPLAAVETTDVDGAACAFLDVCAGGGTLLDAALAALEVEPATDLSALIATLLGAGAFAAVSLSGDSATDGGRT